MAKKVETKAPAKKAAAKKTETKAPVKKAAVKKSDIEEKDTIVVTKSKDVHPELKHLNGLHDYYRAKNNKALRPFFDDVIEELKEFEKQYPDLALEWAEFEEEFNKIFDKQKSFEKCLHITGTLISKLNYLKTLNS